MLGAGAVGIAVLLTAGVPAATVHVPLRQTMSFEHPGATVAYVVDPTVADASASDGRVILFGRGAGSTNLTVVSDTGFAEYELVVDAPPPRLLAGQDRDPNRRTAWEALYDSTSGRIRSTFGARSRADGRVMSADLVTLTHVGGGDDGYATNLVPAASVRLSTPGREVVLFDDLVAESPLAFDGVPLRGAHVRQGALALHGGYTSSMLYQGLLLPTDRESAVGASYRLAFGGGGLVPSLYWFSGSSDEDAARGATASVLYERGREETGLHVSSEVAYGGAFGAGLDLSYQGESRHFRLAARHQPQALASIGAGRPRGTFADAAWDTDVGSRLALSLNGSMNRYEQPLFSQRNGAAAVEARFRLSRRFGLRSGVSLGSFEAGSPPTRSRSLTVPAGFSYDSSRAGVTVLYRYQENGATNSGGHGGRLSGRLSAGGFRLSAFVDRQDETPTLDLVLRDDPALGRALAELGTSAASIEDLARVLRENPALVALGYFEGATVTLDASRLQAGGEVSWRSSRDRHLVQGRVLVDRTRLARGLRETTVAWVQYTGRVRPGLEALASVTRWSSSVEGGASGLGYTSFEAGLRLQFDDVPHLPSSLRRGRVSGLVFTDDEGTGRFTGQAPRPGTEVRLGGRTATTDSRGRFEFEGVEPGPQRVEVVLPPEAGAYFTTPYSVTARSGEPALFGIARAVARVDGTVHDDAGAGLGGVSVRVSGMGRTAHVVTDSSGRLRFAGAEGAYEMCVQPDSLPAGYDVSTLVPQRVELVRGAPARFDAGARAHRSVGGRVADAPPDGVLVRLVELGRETRTASDGTYVFRNLAPGRYTLTTEVGGQVRAREVVVPEGPSLQRDVDLRP